MLEVDVGKVQSIIQEVADTVIVPRFRNLQAHEIHFKSEDNPVTDVDILSERVLAEQLRGILPGSHVVGEETYAADPSILDAFKGDTPVWIIDPLDGTKSYIAGLPYYGVIVALALHNETLASWLYDPTSREFVTAEKGAGAWHKGQKLQVRPPDDLGKMVGVLTQHILEMLPPETMSGAVRGPQLLRGLSCCHDYARLAVQKPHFSQESSWMHFYGTYCTCTPWDSAAGVLVNEEAGGFTAHWTGECFKPSDYAYGLLSAPDRESWMNLRNWMGSFCQMPECVMRS